MYAENSDVDEKNSLGNLSVCVKRNRSTDPPVKRFVFKNKKENDKIAN